jgi:hypothetical protein
MYSTSTSTPTQSINVIIDEIGKDPTGDLCG